jgi:hypothetical protein
VGPQRPKHPPLIRTLHPSVLRSLFETARRQGKKPHQFFLDLFRKTTARAQPNLAGGPWAGAPSEFGHRRAEGALRGGLAGSLSIVHRAFAICQ